MIFNSIEFLIFFVLVFSVYHFILKEKTGLQNLLLLVASYVFYAWVNWKILPLLAVTTAVFYFLGIAIFEAKTDKRKQILNTLGIMFGIGTLLYFKYFNFFISSFKALFESFGLQTNLHTFKILVPIGISFYTFRLLSYIIEIKRGRFEPTRDITAFATYVAFFPCILAGPIDRPATLIPHLKSKRIFDEALATDGMRQILLGLFKKAVIADNCAVYVNQVFDVGIQEHTGSTLIIAAVLYSFQMYADFSGYSDMAIGVAKLLGFRVTKNFDYPFFSQNIAEYWRKWHISLTSWLTDYIFMPLNIKWRDRENWGTIAAIMITFILIGLWHGDNWTFVLFGLYHGLLYIPLILSGVIFKKKKIITYAWGAPKPKILLHILLTFTMVTAGNIIFRSESIGQAFTYFAGIFSVNFLPLNIEFIKRIGFFVITMIFIEWVQRKKQYGLEIDAMNVWLRRLIYIVIILSIIFFTGTNEQFIYFQF